MAFGAIVPGKFFFAVVAVEAILLRLVRFQSNTSCPFSYLKKFRMAIAAIERGVFFMPESDLPLVFSHGNDCIVNGCFVGFGLAFDMTHVLLADSWMTSGALFLGGKSVFAVVTGATVFALVERIHNEIFFLLGKQGLHFKKTAVTIFTADLFRIHMMLMLEENGFYRLGIENAAAVGKTAFP